MFKCCFFIDETQNTPTTMINNAHYHHQRRQQATTTNYNKLLLLSAEFLFSWLFIELIFLLKKNGPNHRFKNAIAPSNWPIHYKFIYEYVLPKTWTTNLMIYPWFIGNYREFSFNFNVPKSSTTWGFCWFFCGTESLNQGSWSTWYSKLVRVWTCIAGVYWSSK